MSLFSAAKKGERGVLRTRGYLGDPTDTILAYLLVELNLFNQVSYCSLLLPINGIFFCPWNDRIPEKNSTADCISALETKVN